MCEHIGHTEAKSSALPVDTTAGSWLFAHHAPDNGRHVAPFGALPLPDRCYLDRIMLGQVSASVEPDSVFWWFETEDGALTDVVETTWVTGKGVAARLDLLHDRTPAAAGLTLRAYGSGGSSIVVRPILFWKVVADIDLTCTHRERLELRRGRV